MSINSGSAMQRRSSIEQIISDNTSNTAMQVRVGSGRTSWRTNANEKKHYPSPQACHLRPVSTHKVAGSQILQMHLQVEWKRLMKYGRSRKDLVWLLLHFKFILACRLYSSSKSTRLSNAPDSTRLVLIVLTIVRLAPGCSLLEWITETGCPGHGRRPNGQ